MDGPGHYFRRIKNVAVTIPCVTGPYSGVNCTLTLLKSSIRKTGTLDGDYRRAADATDARFDDYYGSMQSIVTSSGQNDGGLFETNLRDERYLPFENSGVISEWQLQLPANPAAGDPTQFDYETISDVVLHLRYTAREGGESLARAARADLRSRIEDAQYAGCERIFSLRHDFPVAWAAYKNAAKVAGKYRPITITLTPQHYPFWSRTNDGEGEVRSAMLVARGTGVLEVAKPDGTEPDGLGAFVGDLKSTEISDPPPFTGEWKAALTADGVQDAWLLVRWGRTD